MATPPPFVSSFPENRHSLPQFSSSSTTSYSSNTPPDLTSTISALNDLIQLSESTITSISSSLLSSTVSNDPHLCYCPLNYHHRLPPEYLFSHSLSCPSSGCKIDPSILGALHYRKTLQSNSELGSSSSHDFDADLCFSLDGYSDSGRSFFYRDCPGVVSSYSANTKRSFTLPGVLSVECANFFEEERKYHGEKFEKLLPSELWTVSREIEEWNGYPNVYSYNTVRMILHSESVDESDLKRWLIANSPSFGVVIDIHLADHMFMLLKLCWRAIVKEAAGLMEFLQNPELRSEGRSFKCPILVEVFSWFASQLSVLYGGNARFLCVNVLKRILLQAVVISLSTWFLESAVEKEGSESVVKVDQFDELHREGVSYADGCLRESCVKGNLFGGAKVFLSQIAAAINALHERSLLQGRIKEMQFCQTLSSWQRLSEHAKFLKLADERRKKRADYRPIIEHDSLPGQRSQNQERNKEGKTREEILAEERDYKRRRMSYRGKKLKRSTTEVLRDIIEEYMEEIKQAGGIGCFMKDSDKCGTSQSDQLSEKAASHVGELGISAYCSNEFSESYLQPYVEMPRPCKLRVKDEEIPRLDYEKNKSYSHGLDNNLEYKRNIHGENPASYRSLDRKKEYSSKLDGRDSHAKKGTRYESRKPVQYDNSLNSSRHHRSHHSRHDSLSHSSVEDVAREMWFNGRWQKNSFGHNRLVTSRRSSFEDRYDPSQSCDTYDDDITSGK